MKLKLVIAGALAAIGLSAMAQPFGPPPPPGSFWYGAPVLIHDRIEFVGHRMQAMVAGGHLDKGQYIGLRNDLEDVSIKEKEFLVHDGRNLTPEHRDYLWMRLRNITGKLNWDTRWGY